MEFNMSLKKPAGLDLGEKIAVLCIYCDKPSEEISDKNDFLVVNTVMSLPSGSVLGVCSRCYTEYFSV